MQIGRIMILAIALAVAASLTMAEFGQSAAWAHDTEPWRVTQVNGEAWLQNLGSAARPVHKGDRLAAGGFVITGDSGLVVLSHGGVAITLMPNGRTEVPAVGDHLGRTTVVHRLGNLLAQIEPSPQQSEGQSEGQSERQPKGEVFQVITPFLTASVQGTLFSLRVEEDAATLYVAAGTVEVRSIASGEVALVRAGQSASVSQGGGGRLRVTGAH